MSEITGGNWSARDPGDDIANGDVIRGGNFSRLEPDTSIMVGKTLTIYDGNFVNVRKDANWTIHGGNWAQIVRCANIHPELVALGLSAEIENCPHVVDTDEIWVDGNLIDTIYHYADEVV